MTFKDAPKERLLNSEVLASTFNGTVYVGGIETTFKSTLGHDNGNKD